MFRILDVKGNVLISHILSNKDALDWWLYLMNRYNTPFMFLQYHGKPTISRDLWEQEL